MTSSKKTDKYEEPIVVPFLPSRLNGVSNDERDQCTLAKRVAVRNDTLNTCANPSSISVIVQNAKQLQPRLQSPDSL